ncbi:MAG: NAD+ synthase [Candidatus Njordarchaeales archaeon]
MITIEEIKKRLLDIDPQFVVSRITDFLRYYFSETGAEIAVIGLSGGIDSSVTLTLVTKALGKKKVLAVLMPHRDITPEQDMKDAKDLIELLGVDYVEAPIESFVHSIENHLEERGISLSKIARGNILARIRMIILYSIANSRNGLVVGSSDKSELLLGYFTKYGDGGVDILLLGDLYKSQVRLLGKYLRLPDEIVNKPSSPRLWEGHTAKEELGADYDIIDLILYALVDLKLSPNRILNESDFPKDLTRNIIKRVIRNEHKRSFPIIPKISKGMTIGYDWRYPIIRHDF